MAVRMERSVLVLQFCIYIMLYNFRIYELLYLGQRLSAKRFLPNKGSSKCDICYIIIAANIWECLDSNLYCIFVLSNFQNTFTEHIFNIFNFSLQNKLIKGLLSFKHGINNNFSFEIHCHF